MALIDAAYSAGVRRFAPAEFGGLSGVNLFDRGRIDCLNRIAYLRMETTRFICGILYERFAMGGMAVWRIGQSTQISGEGDYMMDIRNGTAAVPCYNANNDVVNICLTSAADVGRFVVKALDIRPWPPELRMYGERKPAHTLVADVESIRGRLSFLPSPSISGHNPRPRTDTHSGHQFISAMHDTSTLYSEMALAQGSGNYHEQYKVQELINTANGNYDFSSPNLNHYAGFQPVRFRDWLRSNWAP
jgi:hypothetical protein